MEKTTLSVKEVAQYIGVHQETIYTLVHMKQIPHFRCGRRILFSKEMLEMWMEDQIRKNMEKE